MDAGVIIDRMERFGAAFAGVATIATEADAHWKPPSGAWSVVEIVNHLGDEEVDDFRARLRMTLEEPGVPWPLTDPEAWARDGRYNERALRPSVERFVRERAETVRWLREVIATQRADWSQAYIHPRVGPVRAGTILTSWAAHDALHMRQIAKRLFELAGVEAAGRASDGFETAYAGEWGA